MLLGFLSQNLLKLWLFDITCPGCPISLCTKTYLPLTTGQDGYWKELLNFSSSKTLKMFPSIWTRDQKCHMSTISENCTHALPSVASVSYCHPPTLPKKQTKPPSLTISHYYFQLSPMHLSISPGCPLVLSDYFPSTSCSLRLLNQDEFYSINANANLEFTMWSNIPSTSSSQGSGVYAGSEVGRWWKEPQVVDSSRTPLTSRHSRDDAHVNSPGLWQHKTCTHLSQTPQARRRGTGYEVSPLRKILFASNSC